MTRRTALLAVLALWTLLFLPGLGSTEIKGEEGRRILPAVAMLETGDWLVPQIAGEPYLRKPPLINWLIAASFKATGVRNEWTARLPSVLAILALALVTVSVVTPWLGAETAFMAAAFAITNIGMIEKGRLAEIEGVYVALSGVAMICWLAWWARNRSPWLVWTVPFIFLGLAALTKGPLHLLFFYAVVIAALGSKRQLRQLVRPAHVAGIILMCGIFAVWAVPYFEAAGKFGAAGVWEDQMKERVGGGSFDLGAYLVNIPRALSNWLPWLIFVPLWWRRVERADAAFPPELFRSLRLATVATFAGLMLIPGVLPRYTLPLVGPAGLLTAVAMSGGLPAGALLWWRRLAGWWTRRPLGPALLVFSTGMLMGALMLLYVIFAVPQMNARAETRQFGAEVDRAIPPGETLLIYDVGFQPALFYIRSPHLFLTDDRQLPARCEYVLMRAETLKKIRKKFAAVEERAQLSDKNGRDYFVVALRDRRD